MFSKKQFFSVCLSVLLSVSLVGLVAQAASTVGDDITVGDDLTVTGAAAVTETLGVTGATTLTTLTASGTSTLSVALLVDTNVLYADSNENKVGVNSTSTTNIFAVSTSSADTAFGPYLVVTTAGRVGVASSSPATALSVGGTSTLQNVIPATDAVHYLGISGKSWLAVLSTTTITSASIGSSGTAITKHLSTSSAIDLPSVTASSCATSAVSVQLPGVVAGNVVVASPTSAAGNTKIEYMPLVWSAMASSTAGYVTLTVCNQHGYQAFDPASQVWTFDVWAHGY